MQVFRRVLLFFLAFSFAVIALSAVAQRVIDTISVGIGPGALAVNTATNKIYVTTATDYPTYTITIIDGATDNITTLNVGLTPVDVAVDSTRNKIYVAGTISGFTGGVTVIDGATLSTTTVQVGRGTSHVAVNSTTNKVYAVNSADDTVTVIDGATLSTTTVPIGQYTQPTTIKVDETTNKIWVLDYNANSVTVIDGTTLSTTAVPVGQNPVDVAINRSTNKVFVTIYDYIYGNTVTVIDGVTLSTTTVNVGIDPWFVVVNETTNQIYVSHSLVAGMLTIIDGATLSTSTVSAGPGPAEMGVDTVRNKIYVINTINEYGMVTALDGSNHSRTTVGVGLGPAALAVNQVTDRIYVSNRADNTVSVIDGTPPTALQFVPLSQPCRAVDTRPEHGGGGPIQGGTFQNFPISGAGSCGALPSAAAYSMNVSVVPAGPLGYLTVWPAGQPQPLVSTLNSLDGRIKANAAIVPAGTSGEISVYASNTTNVLVDVNGYFAPVSSSTLAFYPLPPCRVADTRKNNFPPGLGSPYLPGGQERAFPILNATSCNIPSSAAAYSLNFSVVPHGALFYMTVWPTGESRPLASTLNDIPGQIIANAAIVVAGTGGDVSVYPTNDTDLVIDINGYFTSAGQGGLSLYGVQPCRVIDTRHVGSGQPFSGTLSPPVDVVDTGCAASSLAQAYVFNASVVPTGALGYLTLWPDGSNQPVVSTLNALDGSISSNMAIVPNTNGKVDAYASGLTQLILDISSYFAP